MKWLWNRWQRWRTAKVRLINFGKRSDGRGEGAEPRYPNYIRYTPDFGFSHSWPKNKRTGFRRRIRYAKHHGCQIVEWRKNRWVVTKQVLGKSKVIGGNHLMKLSPKRRK